MKISSIFISVFLLCAAIFVGGALRNWFSPWSFLSGLTLAGAGGYCVLVACLIWWSRGLGRGIFMGISAAIFMVYILRLLVLTFSPDEFAHKFLPVVFSSETVNSALLFMAGSTVALALLVYAIIVGIFIRWVLTMLRGSSGIIRDASVPVLALLYWGFGYTLIRSGSMDNVFSGTVRELVTGLLVLAFIQIVGSTVRDYRLRRRLDTIPLGKGI